MSAMVIPRTFVELTWLPRTMILSVMMKIRLVAFATAYVSGVTRFSTVNARQFWGLQTQQF